MNFKYEYAGEDVFETLNPATSKIGRYKMMAGDDLGRVMSANIAQTNGQMPGLERSQRLNAFIDAVEANADTAAGTLSRVNFIRKVGETLKSCAEGRFL